MLAPEEVEVSHHVSIVCASQYSDIELDLPRGARYDVGAIDRRVRSDYPLRLSEPTMMQLLL